MCRAYLPRFREIPTQVASAVKNLAHSASLHARENIAPSKSGIKHLVAHVIDFDGNFWITVAAEQRGR
jgi:hypothetical protein